MAYNLQAFNGSTTGYDRQQATQTGRNRLWELNDVFVIMAMPFGLFGRGLYRYTFGWAAEEVPGLELRLAAPQGSSQYHGADKTGVSDELNRAAELFRAHVQQAAEASGNENRRMHRKIDDPIQ